jgi:hypothetical protein
MKPYIASLPNSVRVGPFDFEIIKWPNITASTSSRWGECSIGEQVVRIDDEIATPFKAVDTLLHEIDHAVTWAYGIKDEDKEERRVAARAVAWTQIFRDNRWLLKWIDQTLCKSSRISATISLKTKQAKRSRKAR